MLQAKINAYISFLDEKQYEDIYQDVSIMYGIIEIHFLHSYTQSIKQRIQYFINDRTACPYCDNRAVLKNDYCMPRL